LLNINVPSGVPRGVKLTRLGVRRYTEGVVEDVDPRGRKIFWIGGGEAVWEATPGTDFHELAEGFVTVSPLNLDMTDHDYLERLCAAVPDWVASNDACG
jgi:5'-nucleotidase